MSETGFYKELLENLSTALLVLEPDLRISFISPAAQALLELSESRGLGGKLEELLQGLTARQSSRGPPSRTAGRFPFWA